MSELMWVPVPAGPLRGGKPVLGVVMVPRLTDTLAAAGMADWPTSINGASSLRVQVRPSGSTDPDQHEPTATLRSAARSDVWQGFFGTISVAPFSRPRGYHPPFVANTSKDADDVRATYARAAVAIGDPETVEQELATWQTRGVVAAQGQPDIAAGRDPVPDFHRAVALLREHPHVLRLLGMIVELELEGLPESDSDREISVTWAGSPIPVRPRWTRYHLDDELFLPADSGDVSQGMVDLTDPDRWRIISFDVDGGVGKLRGAARTMAEDRSRLAEGLADPGARATLPPLRSAGMMLTRVGRETQLAKRSAQGLAAAAGVGDEKVLTAEDLVLGYRIDVRLQERDRWFSLHRRRATYRIGGLPEIVVDDEEGHVKPHAAVLDDAGLRTDEVVARWDGWSLSVPRPKVDGTPEVRRRSGAALPYDFEVRYTAKEASLLELEFGRAYQMRVRVADLAGGGLLLDDHAAGKSTPFATYARHEPVPPPGLTPIPGLLVPDPLVPGTFRVDSSVVGPGGSLEGLVIRSEPVGGGDGDDFTTTPFDGDPAYPDNHIRRLNAPTTTVALAEQHGVLRFADDAGLERVNRAFVAGREDEAHLNDGSAGVPLPDPAALGVAVAVLAQRQVFTAVVHDDRPWEGTWPERVGKQIELAPGDRHSRPQVRWITVDDRSSPDGQASPRVRVELPPGCQMDVEVSCTVDANKIDHFALTRFLQDGVGTGSPTAAQDAMVNGRHPLLSPPLRLTLTHAVRRPLGTASGQVRVERAAGDTMARISPAPPTDPPTDPTTPEQAIWGIDVPSTGSVAVRARWQEWSDAPEPVATSADVAQLHLPRGTEQLPEIPHDFGDTKHRQVTFDVTAISRFRDCFVDDDEELFTTTGPLQEVSVLSTARPPAPVVLSVVPAFSWRGEREAGSVLRQRLGGRLRVELARPWFTTGQGEALAVLVWPGTEDALPEGMRDQVTWCNRDPIHATTSPQALVTLAQCAGAEAILDVQDPASGTSIKALIYPVFFHEGHWYADVALPGVASSSYAPLVRLAVARAQPHSLVDDQVDLRLSSVVTADLTPVLPDRTLDIIRTNDTLQVRLSGLGRLAPSQGNRVFASLERRAGTVADAADGADLTSLGPSDPAFPAWVRVADGTVAGELGEDLPPLTLAAGTEHLRLVVREVEEMHSDVSALGVDAPDELADRTVFVDVVDLAGL